MRYALLICGDETTVGGEDPERYAAYQAFMDHLGDRLLYGLRLRPIHTATTVQVRNSEMVIADGPLRMPLGLKVVSRLRKLLVGSPSMAGAAPTRIRPSHLSIT